MGTTSTEGRTAGSCSLISTVSHCMLLSVSLLISQTVFLKSNGLFTIITKDLATISVTQSVHFRNLKCAIR